MVVGILLAVGRKLAFDLKRGNVILNTDLEPQQ